MPTYDVYISQTGDEDRDTRSLVQVNATSTVEALKAANATYDCPATHYLWVDESDD